VRSQAAVLAIFLAVTVACGGGSGTTRAHPPASPVVVQALHLTGATRRFPVTAGDTLESVCRRLDPEEWNLWCSRLASVLDPRALRPGMMVEGRCAPYGPLESVVVDLDLRSSVKAQRLGDEIQVERVDRPVRHEVVRLEGSVESSLFGAVESAGGDAELAVRLAAIFQWDIDFFRDLRKGDSFVVIVDRRTVDGRPYGWGNLFAARFVNAGRTLNAVAFPDDDGRIGYYDLEGHPLRKEFLRTPLRFSRITSRFSLHRYHPVLHRRMPHYGVDYGAPVGTPVHVTADGVVRFVGRKGGAGKMITVRHTNGYETSYLHLSRYARGIHRGVRVHQGQVIGYVGQTGLATGPHLDYRVRHNGKWINPLRISSPPAKPIARKRLGRFLSYAITVQALLDGKEPPRGAMG